MKINKETVKYVSNLARINLSEVETENLSKKMGDIIGYMDKLNSLDTTGVKAMEHVKPVSNIFRDDIVSKSYDRDEILKNAPEQEDGAFKVPKIVD